MSKQSNHVMMTAPEGFEGYYNRNKIRGGETVPVNQFDVDVMKALGFKEKYVSKSAKKRIEAQKKTTTPKPEGAEE